MLYKHYKGGKYRKLFEAIIVGSEDFDELKDTVIFEAKHSDDGHLVKVFTPLRSGGLYVYDPKLHNTGCGVVVVYVNLEDQHGVNHGTIHVRQKSEFYGDIYFGGQQGTTKRFEPVESFS